MTDRQGSSSNSADSAAADRSQRLQRRRLVLAGVAGAAVAGGVALGWRQALPEHEGSNAVNRFWQLEFETPTGGTIRTHVLRGRPLLVNFWATWCPPCIDELPMLDAFYREHSAQAFQILGLAIDQPAAVRKFLERMPLAFPTALAGLEGIQLTRSLGNEAGGLPFSLLIGARGGIEHRRLGTLTLQDLQLWFSQVT